MNQLENKGFQDTPTDSGFCQQLAEIGLAAIGRCQEVSSSKQDSSIARRQEDNQTAKMHSGIVRSLTQMLSANVFDVWFDQGRNILVKKHRVEIQASNEFLLNRIQKTYFNQIRTAVEEVCGPEFSIQCRVNRDPSESTKTESVVENRAANISASSATKVPTSESEAEPKNAKFARRRGADSFYFGKANRLAEVSIEQMFQQLGQLSPLVLYGPAGCGKTHLLESLVFDARRKHKFRRCVSLSAEQFTGQFVQAVRGTGLPVFRRKYRDLDLLAIDDVQFFAGKKATLAEFQYTMDNLIRNGKQIILSSDRPPVDLQPLGQEVMAKIYGGMACPLAYPDAEGRYKIVRELCRRRGFDVSDEVLRLISNRLARDVRRLSGALNRINAFSMAMGKTADLALAKEALGDLFSLCKALTSIGTIEKVVCDFCGVKPDELKSASRHKKICSARMLAMYLSRKHTANAFSEIGDYFGRAHSTVIAAHKKFETMVSANETLDFPNAQYRVKDALSQIESNLRVG